MKTALALLLSAALPVISQVPPAAREEGTSVIVVAGAGGNEEYDAAFAGWAKKWEEACQRGGARAQVLLPTAGKDTRDRIRGALKEALAKTPAELWLVLLGHGTWDGKEGRFNTAGADVTISDLSEWLRDFERPVVVVAGFSTSGAFLRPLSAPGRVIVTATRSGAEDNYARFGQYISEAIGDPAADVDKDGQVSLLEAWLAGHQRVTAFYKEEGRLATEHALLDDNGDGLGTPPDWFSGLRVVKKSKDNAMPDGFRANQLHLIRSTAEAAIPAAMRAERDRLEVEIEALRREKASLPEDDYYQRLEALLLKVAELYSRIPAAGS